jgi:hypothetical protein
MSQSRRLAVYVAEYSRRVGAIEGETKPSRCPVEPRSLPHTTTITVVSVIIVVCVASAAWWAWRFVSLELAAVYAEGFRKAGIAEEWGSRTPVSLKARPQRSEPKAHS